MITRYDEEIHEVEDRIARERAALVEQAEDLGHTAVDAAVSPKGLLAAAAVGFVLGEMLKPRRPASAAASSTRKLGWTGLLGSAALALLKSQYGSPLALSRSAWNYAAAQRARRSAMAASTPADYARPPARAPRVLGEARQDSGVTL
ncbi:MAG: hypothetical protein IT531_19620 [Burkholderiales bacterium]|nr:hypothetical protein [Burkholderiales bacterium]